MGLVDVTTREAVPDDAAGAAAVYVASAEHHHGLDPTAYRVPSLEAVTSRYRDQLAGGDEGPVLLVADEDGRVVGSCLTRLLPEPSEGSMLIRGRRPRSTSRSCRATAAEASGTRS